MTKNVKNWVKHLFDCEQIQCVNPQKSVFGDCSTASVTNVNALYLQMSCSQGQGLWRRYLQRTASQTLQTENQS